MWSEHQVGKGRGARRHHIICGTVHTRPCLALNLFVRELSKRHDSCECTIRSLLERTPPCNVSELVGQQDFSYFCLFVLQNWSTVSTVCWTCRHGCMPLCFIFDFFLLFFLHLTMEACGLKRHRLWHHRQLPYPMRAKPHLPDAKVYANTHSFHLCVCVCVYRYIYKEREIFMNLFFLFCDESYYYETNKKQFFLVEHCHVILKGSV